MKFYFQAKNGNIAEMTEAEAREFLGEGQIEEGIEAKKADPMEEVSFMVDGGFVVIDF